MLYRLSLLLVAFSLATACGGSVDNSLSDSGGDALAGGDSASGDNVGDSGSDTSAGDTYNGSDTVLGDTDTCDLSCYLVGPDTDGDGLPDVWEDAAGNSAVLNSQDADSDNDGIDDGFEDPDQDGLDNRDELAASRFGVDNGICHPLRRDVLIEVDAMNGKTPIDAVLAEVVEAFAAISDTNFDGTTGIVLHFVRDELTISAASFDGSFTQRWNFFAAHPPIFSAAPEFPKDKLVHVAFVSERTDIAGRGGEVVADDVNNDPERTGLLVYYDTLLSLMPACGTATSNPPEVTFNEALANTLTHELGHILQLNHDTAVGGGINYWNVMSVPTSCTQMQQRFHGYQNQDANLGNTQAVSAPRFSQAAINLINLRNKVSVDTALLMDVEM